MTIDIDDAGPILEIAVAAAGRQNPMTTVADIQTLYGLFQQIKAGKFVLSATVKSGQFPALVDDIAREAALLSALLKDPSEGPKIIKLLSDS